MFKLAIPVVLNRTAIATTHLQQGKTNLSHDSLTPAHVPFNAARLSLHTSQQKARSALFSVLFHSDLEAEVLLSSVDFFFCYLSDLPMPPAPCEKNIPLLTFSQSDHFRCKHIWLTIALKTYSFKQPYFQRRYFSPFLKKKNWFFCGPQKHSRQITWHHNLNQRQKLCFFTRWVCLIENLKM